MKHLRRAGFAVAALLVLAGAATAADRPIELVLDATETPRNRFKARLTIPAEPGTLTLHYPKWIPGEHGPTGPITDLVNIRFRTGDTVLPWARDDHDAHTIRVTVPAGATSIEAGIEFLTSPEKSGFSRGASCTPRLGVLSWNQVLLYPAGKPITAQKVRPTVLVPEGWSLGCAMSVARRTGARTEFNPVSVEELCDSPVLCGRYYKEIPIGPKSGPPHFLCLAADTEAGLTVPDDVKTALDRLVVESTSLFGVPHYRSYRFLLALSDHVAHFGMEHHESSDNRGPAGMFTDPLYRGTWHAWLLSHEFCHSWNGKFRRPAGMVVPDYQRPLSTRLLWVYEGLTHYYGFVLAARCGMWKPERAREYFARIADRAVHQPGREWRSLDDTAATGRFQYAARDDGWFRRRGTDFYDEAALVWLDADTLIREGTKGARSLDDFCRRFHGGDAGTPLVKAYELDDVIRELNAVHEHDWKEFFRARVMTPGAKPPVGGLIRGGWKLEHAPVRTEHLRNLESDTKTIELTASLGLILKDTGEVIDTVPGKPADAAGVVPGMKLLAVNGRRWTPTELQTALSATGDKNAVITLLTEQSDVVGPLTLKYSGSARYPTLVRSKDTPDLLTAILSRRESGKSK